MGEYWDPRISDAISRHEAPGPKRSIMRQAARSLDPRPVSPSAEIIVIPLNAIADPGYAPKAPHESARRARQGLSACFTMLRQTPVPDPTAMERTMTTVLKIDFVSDISCPWCAIGLSALEQALGKLQGEVAAELHFQPFELNPQMPPGGQDITEHLTQKYGSTPAQQTQIRDTIRQRGADVGFAFNPGGRGRIYNTFDAHRLLHWAALESADKQIALKKLLGSTRRARGRYWAATNSPPRCASARRSTPARASIRCRP